MFCCSMSASEAIFSYSSAAETSSDFAISNSPIIFFLSISLIFAIVFDQFCDYPLVLLSVLLCGKRICVNLRKSEKYVVNLFFSALSAVSAVNEFNFGVWTSAQGGGIIGIMRVC